MALLMAASLVFVYLRSNFQQCVCLQKKTAYFCRYPHNIHLLIKINQTAAFNNILKIHVLITPSIHSTVQLCVSLWRDGFVIAFSSTMMHYFPVLNNNK